MRAKKRYLLLHTLPKDLPKGSKFLFQNERGFVIKADLVATELLRKHAILVSGAIRKLKTAKRNS
ncbi:MAG: hypothetical protein ACREBS_11650 [Nitrososphaerales archaeon]